MNIKQPVMLAALIVGQVVVACEKKYNPTPIKPTEVVVVANNNNQTKQNSSGFLSGLLNVVTWASSSAPLVAPKVEDFNTMEKFNKALQTYRQQVRQQNLEEFKKVQQEQDALNKKEQQEAYNKKIEVLNQKEVEAKKYFKNTVMKSLVLESVEDEKREDYNLREMRNFQVLQSIKTQCKTASTSLENSQKRFAEELLAQMACLEADIKKNIEENREIDLTQKLSLTAKLCADALKLGIVLPEQERKAFKSACDQHRKYVTQFKEAKAQQVLDKKDIELALIDSQTNNQMDLLSSQFFGSNGK